MKTSINSFIWLMDALPDFNENAQHAEVKPRPHYDGQFGKGCVGFVTPDAESLIMALGALLTVSEETDLPSVTQLGRSIFVDQMAARSIVYFPTWHVTFAFDDDRWTSYLRANGFTLDQDDDE